MLPVSIPTWHLKKSGGGLMLTEAQFYLRIFEEVLKDYSVEDNQHIIYNSADLAEFMKKNFDIVSDEEDMSNEAYEKRSNTHEQIQFTLRGFVQAMGKKVGIDLKFMPEN